MKNYGKILSVCVVTGSVAACASMYRPIQTAQGEKTPIQQIDDGVKASIPVITTINPWAGLITNGISAITGALAGAGVTHKIHKSKPSKLTPSIKLP